MENKIVQRTHPTEKPKEAFNTVIIRLFNRGCTSCYVMSPVRRIIRAQMCLKFAKCADESEDVWMEWHVPILASAITHVIFYRLPAAWLPCPHWAHSRLQPSWKGDHRSNGSEQCGGRTPVTDDGGWFVISLRPGRIARAFLFSLRDRPLRRPDRARSRPGWRWRRAPCSRHSPRSRRARRHGSRSHPPNAVASRQDRPHPRRAPEHSGRAR